MPERSRSAARPRPLIRIVLAAASALAVALSGSMISAPAVAAQNEATSQAVVESTATVSGRLRREEAPHHPIRTEAHVVHVIGSSSDNPNSYHAGVDGEGRFTISGIEPGRYYISIGVPGDYFYMKEVLDEPYLGMFFASRRSTFDQERDLEAGQHVSGDFLVPHSLFPFGYERERLAGADRYETAAAVSQYAFLEPTPLAFLASGQDFPDALSAAPAAAVLEAPLLLTARDAVPSAIVAELRRLRTQHVVIVGGVGTVSRKVETQLIDMGIQITRLAGADRYETSIRVAQYAFPVCDQVNIATGANFPDALALSTQNGPLLLTAGTAPALRTDTLGYIESLDCVSARIAGGPAVVSIGIEEQVGSMMQFGVQRYAGADRYETARLIADRGGVQRPHVFVASGSNFPDALAIATYAGRIGSPLYLTPQYCFPEAVLSQIKLGSPAVLTAVGGYGVLGYGIEDLSRCF